MKAKIKIKRRPFPKKPRTRGDCYDSMRPCPWVSCRYHLFLDVIDGDIKEYARDPIEMEYSCALDLAEEGGMKLEDIKSIYNLSRERIRQITEHAIRKMRFR